MEALLQEDIHREAPSLKPQRKVLIYNCDPAIRKAYASYLNRNGISADSCGTLPELKRLFSWYEYEFILVNVESLQQGSTFSTLSQLESSLNVIIQEHQAGDPILIATSSQPEVKYKLWDYSWFLQEPLTPKSILTTISKIRQQHPVTGHKGRLKLRKSLSKPMALD